jgi:hypothetical protein
VRRHFTAAVTADRDQGDAFARRAVRRRIKMADGEIMAEADDLVDQERHRIRRDAPRRRPFEQPALDLGAAVVERPLEQRDHRAAARSRIAAFGGNGVELRREIASVDDRAAMVEIVEQVAHGSSAISRLSV